jgi:hypothetical protein
MAGTEIVALQRGLPIDAEFRRAFETTAALLRDTRSDRLVPAQPAEGGPK